MRFSRILASAIVFGLALFIGLTQGTYGATFTFTVDSLADTSDAVAGDGVCDTDDSAGDGPCTLRAAIQESKADAGIDTINFSTSGTIKPGAALPTITFPVVIDGSTATGYVGPGPTIILDGSGGLSAGTSGLTITGTGSEVAALAIVDFPKDGIRIIGGGSNVLGANYIGMAPDGVTIRANGDNGINIEESPGNFIGFCTLACGVSTTGNLISGNSINGIRISGEASDGNVVSYNGIGTDVDALVDKGNGFRGVVIQFGADDNIIGSQFPEFFTAGNIISGNGIEGVLIKDSDTTGNKVVDNAIGTDITFAAPLPNTVDGVRIDGAKDNIIGPGNIISGNGDDGVEISGSGATGNVVRDNFIGTNAAGDAGLGNSFGVFITSPSNTIGPDNVISGNDFSGVTIAGSGAAGNTVTGNEIGNAALANGTYGVLISSDATSNTVGPGNLISGNTDDGVAIAGVSAIENRITENSITANGELGIDFDDDGVTANDLNDTDASPNLYQNFPVLDTALYDAGVTRVTGSLNSLASTTFTIELFSNTACDGSGNGEGETFLGSTSVTTDGSSPFDANFVVELATGDTVGEFITATATDPSDNTSEFSACDVEVAEGPFAVSHTVTVGSTAAGAARATTTKLTVPYPGNFNWDTYITFDPAADVTQSCNIDTDGDGTVDGNEDGFADAYDGNGDGDSLDGGREDDPCLKAGETVGTVTLDMYLGTLNTECFNNIAPVIPLYAVALPDDVTNPRGSGNIAYTQPQDTSAINDRFGRWSDSGTIAEGGGAALSYTSQVADADNIPFKNYPEFLLDLYDADGASSGNPLVPHAVYGGFYDLGVGVSTPIYIVTFEPGALAAEFAEPNPLGRATTNLGYASQTVIYDPTASTNQSLSGISAYCSTSVETTLSATVDGITRAENPAGGTHLNLAWVASLRDLDNDLIENPLDTCASALNIDGDPRVGGSDPDGDMIDSACDTVANGFLGPGVDDGDTTTDAAYYNTLDSCTEVTNSLQLDSELALGVELGYAAGRADDGGPLADGIGDACDSEIGALSVTYNDLPHTITPSDTVANGRWVAKALVTPICYGAFTDADTDGYCKEDADVGFDGDDTRWSSWTLTPVLSAVLGVTDSATAGSWDTDGAGASGGLAKDSDWVETYVGTDSRQPCSLSATGLSGPLPDEPMGAYLFDYNTDQLVDFGDILPVAPVFGGSAAVPGTATTPPAVRFDWNVDGWVDFGDILTIAAAFGQACTPIVGPQ